MNTKSLALAVVMGTLIAGPAFAADNAAPATAPAVSATIPTFISQAQPGDWRASKLVGVDIYGPDNKSIGNINDVIVNRDGSIKAVVIGVGGFLGVGEKNVAVPFAAVKWMDTPAVNAASNTATDTTGSINSTPTPAPVPAAPVAAAAPAVYDYPDHGVLDMSKDQLQNAPTFSYASERK